MKEYLINILNKIKGKSVLFKTFLSFAVILYFGLIAICVIPVKTKSTVPGTITNVSSFIQINSGKNKINNVYTVSVYDQPRMSVLQYLFTKMDRNSEVYLGEKIQYEIFTKNEDHLSDLGYKVQSIQDALIVAYDKAKKEGYDVNLIHNYRGEYLIHIPQNLLGTGAEDFKNADVIQKVNGVNINNYEDLYKILDDTFSKEIYNGKSIKQYNDEGMFEFKDNDGNKIQNNINLFINIFKDLELKKTNNKYTVIRFEDSGNSTVEKEYEITPSLRMLLYLYTNKVVKLGKTNEESTIYTIGDNRFSYFKIDYSNSKPNVKIGDAKTVGPSGGLMQTLAVYNYLTEKDVTKGWRVMGTGAINLNGDALPIGGEKQKVAVADLFSADLFFIPTENYESAKEVCDKRNYKFHLVSVNSIDDVISYLNSMEEKK